MSDKNDWMFDSTEFDPNANSSVPIKKIASYEESALQNPLENLDDSDFIITESIEANLNRQDNLSTRYAQVDEFPIPVINDGSSKKKHSKSIKTMSLTAESLRVFSSINIDNLGFDSKFDLLFNDLSMLKATAVQGLLGDTNFRFLAWMIFLECIPMEKISWLDSINGNRSHFEKIKKELSCDPRSLNEDIKDHPLSQEKSSTWNKYFHQKDSKSVIIQDVNRINQHSEYFSYQSTRDSIINLLFFYVQSYEIEYKQGMHEILTCIMYVLHEEYSNLLKINETNDIIQKVVNLDYLEHDTFTIFTALMVRINGWFGTRSILTSYDKHSMTESLSKVRKTSFTCLTPKLFRENEEFYESVIINKINHISNIILQNNDIEVHNHLNLIGVTVHPFGIRWLRLLFLRELEFPQCLILWDAMFATDSQELNLVNYLFVSLLVCLRDDILSMDNSSCMKLLMQPHFYLDPLDVLKTALYLQNPAIYTRPDSMENSYELVNTYLKNDLPKSSYRTRSNQLITSALTTQHLHSNIPRATSSFNNLPDERDRNNNSKYNNGIRNSNSVNNFNQNSKTKTYQNNNSFNPIKIAEKLEYDFSANSVRAKRNDKRTEMRLFGMEHMCHNTDLITHAYINKIQQLQNENDSLKEQLREQKELCNLAAIKINSNLKILEEEIKISAELRENDLVLLAADGLRQISTQLNTNFQFESPKQEFVN